MENELEVVNIRLVKEPSLYSEQTLDSPQAVVELMAKELSQYDREVFCILNMMGFLYKKRLETVSFCVYKMLKKHQDVSQNVQ